MNRTTLHRVSAMVVAIGVAGTSASPAAGTGETVSGQARVVQATTLATAVLADTGTLEGSGDARQATLSTGNVSSLLSAEVLRAVTVGWPDQVASEASLSNLKMAVGGTSIRADFVMARAFAVRDGAATASTLIGNLAVNGVSVAVTGSPNQTIAIPGGQLVINEQRVSAAGTTVNAIHAAVAGVADVVVATATAGIQ
jgi:hypothetical protein